METNNLIPIRGIEPSIHESAWVAHNATLTGDIQIGAKSSIWYQVVIRGDVNKIRIGANVNIQDASIVHGSHGGQDTTIGNNVSVGHRAIIHGCSIHDDVLIGMGAIILDNAIVESNVVVAAGSVVTVGKRLESGFIYGGVPAKKIKALTPEAIQLYIEGTAKSYVENAKYYKENT